MAFTFRDNINTTSVLSQIDEDNQNYQEKIGSLLEKKNELDDDEKIERCSLI